MRTLRPNLGAFHVIRGSSTLNQFADQIGVDRSTVYRVFTGKSAPSPRFIAQALTQLPYNFDHLFVVVDEPAKGDTQLN